MTSVYLQKETAVVAPMAKPRYATFLKIALKIADIYCQTSHGKGGLQSCAAGTVRYFFFFFFTITYIVGGFSAAASAGT